MTPEQEKKVLEALYDRLYDAITYQPENGNSPFDQATTFLHFAKNGGVNPSSFENAVSPSNPRGDLKASEEFSRMVDRISPLELEWSNTGSSLSEAYSNLVQNANAYTQEDPKAKAMYDKAYNYLHKTITKKDPFDDDAPEVTSTIDSPAYTAYLDNQDDYVAAITAYRNSYNLYLDDLDNGDERADRKWQAQAPTLENAIKKAYRNLVAGDGEYVERALNILQTTINDGIRAAITKAKELVGDDRKFSSAMGAGNKWLLSYATPSNWTDPNAVNYTSLKLSGGNTKIRNSESSNKFSVDASVNYGLWRVKASAEGEFKNEKSHMSKDSLEISAEIGRVDINRPWFMESIFRLQNWATNIAPTIGSISTGVINSENKGYIPMYPVSFIVARNIQIKADFTQEDREFVSKAISGSASVGYGPFSIGGSYAHGSSDEKIDSSFENGTISVGGVQIIGWVSRVVPKSPLMADPPPTA